MNQIRPQARDAIIEAAFQLFGRDPSASLADIAERAGVGRATLHRHFKGRDDLMVVLAHTAMRELDEAVDTATEGAPTYT
ncbi:MAG: TetR/AcrR family transcriptional regulator [Geminicoccaceae bacterium]